MKLEVMLSIKGIQHYEEQEPETLELVTDGILEQTDTGWSLSYEESALTGLEGVRTAFTLEPGRITLSRTGKLSSTMVFQNGILHESLYRMEFGALLVTVCANKVQYDLSHRGGTVDIGYAIDIEQSAAGYIDYHLTVTPK